MALNHIISAKNVKLAEDVIWQISETDQNDERAAALRDVAAALRTLRLSRSVEIIVEGTLDNPRR